MFANNTFLVGVCRFGKNNVFQEVCSDCKEGKEYDSLESKVCVSLEFKECALEIQGMCLIFHIFQGHVP